MLVSQFTFTVLVPTIATASLIVKGLTTGAGRVVKEASDEVATSPDESRDTTMK